MNDIDLTNQILERLGIFPKDCGPMVSELRSNIHKKVKNGMKNMHFSLGPEANDVSKEEIARELLAWDWEIDHKHSCEVRAFDGLYSIQKDVLTGKRYYKIYWSWFGDQFRKMNSNAIKAFHNIVGIKNPFKRKN